MKDWRTLRDEALFTLEHESGPDLRAEAAEVLCDLAAAEGARRAELAPALPRLLADRQEEVRAAGFALCALTLEPDEAEGVLARGLGDAAPRVRAEAAGRLADLALPGTRGLLAQALLDPSFAVQFEGARGMAALRHKAGLEVLLAALDDSELRFRALGALAELGDSDALPAIRKIFHKLLLPAFDRTQAAGALALLGDEEGARHLLARSRKQWTPDRAMAIELLGEVKAPGAFARFAELLADRRDPCLGAAARGLGRLGDGRGLALLQSLLGDPGLADHLRLDAAEGLLLLGDRASAEAALSTLNSPEARQELRKLLEETR